MTLFVMLVLGWVSCPVRVQHHKSVFELIYSNPKFACFQNIARYINVHLVTLESIELLVVD